MSLPPQLNESIGRQWNRYNRVEWNTVKWNAETLVGLPYAYVKIYVIIKMHDMT